MNTYNTIRLVDYSNKFKELKLETTMTPGMHVERSTAGKVAPCAEGKTRPQKMFLFEQELLGQGPDDTIGAGEIGQIWFPARGDEILAFLTGDETVSVGDQLSPDGAGHLQATTNSAAGDPVGIALEDMDTSGSSAARIIVETL